MMYVALKEDDRWYESEVYAIINTGYSTRYLLKIENEGREIIGFYDYLDKSSSSPTPKIEIINPEHPQDWIWKYSEYENTTIAEYEALIDDKVEFFIYGGQDWLFEDKALLSSLINGEKLLLKNSVFEEHLLKSKLKDWMFIKNNEDIEFFLKHSHNMHDSVVKEFSYISGAYVDSDKSMYPCADMRRLNLILDSQITDKIEMIFEGLISLNLEYNDDATVEILGCTLRYEGDNIFFCDDEDEKCSTIKIIAKNLCWRFKKD